MDETVRFQTLDGLWEVGGTVRARGIWPEGLNVVANRKGPDTARFVLRREPGMPWPDLLAYTPVDIVRDGIVGWEGFVDDTPEEDDYSIAVQCLGWQHHLDHDTYQKAYVHTKLTEWRDQRSFLEADLTRCNAAGQIEVGDGGIVLGQANGTTWANDKAQIVTLDLGPTSTAKRVVVDVEQINLNGNTVFDVYVRGHDAPNPLAGSFEDAITQLNGAVTSTVYAGTFTTARRYVSIMLIWQGAGGVTGTDELLRVKSALVFADTAYESGNASILKDDVIWKDALTRAPLIDGEQSGIQPQSFNFPEFAMSEDRTPGEVGDALDAVTNGVRKVQQPGRRPILKARPTVPLLRAGPWAGSSFKDSSKNSGREIYNRALVRGSGPAGEQLRVERFAGHQPGSAGELLSSPSFPNPSFDSDLAGWSQIATPALNLTRSTGVFDSTPASMNAQNISKGTDGASYVYTDGSAGTFKKGVAYRVTIRYRAGGSSGSHYVRLRLGTTTGDFNETLFPSIPYSVFTSLPVIWIPAADRPAASVRFEVHANIAAGSATDFYIDTLTVERVAAVLPDRRGFVRTKVHSMSQALNVDIGTQIADTFLQTHARAPLKGELAVTGRGGVRRYLGDAAVDPFELLLYTAELVHLADQIDPDLGTIGRDGLIDAVTYTGDDEGGTVAIDNQRDNFEAVVERYQVVAGAGR